MPKISDTIKGSGRYLDSLSQEERKEYVKKASTIFESDVFHKEIDRFIEDTVYEMAEEWHTEQLHYFGSGNINGVEKLRENFKLLHGEFIQQVKDAESKETDVPVLTLEELS